MMIRSEFHMKENNEKHVAEKEKTKEKFNKNKENFNKNKEKSLKQKREQWKFNWAKVMTKMVCLLMIQRYLYNH